MEICGEAEGRCAGIVSWKVFLVFLWEFSTVTIDKDSGFLLYGAEVRRS